MTRRTRLPVPGGVLRKFDPFQDLLMSPMEVSRLLQGPWGGDGEERQWVPAMDVSESNEGYTVTVEIPGAKREDITVESQDNVVTIRGEKRDEREEKDEHRHYLERRYGTFSRSFRLPADASDDIRAAFRDGVLTVEVPKQEEKKPQSIAIKG